MCNCDKNCNCNIGNGGLLAAGLVFGAIVGAAAALLLTPTKGDKNRSIAKEYGKKFYDKSSEKLSELNKDKIAPAVAKAKSELANKASEYKQKAVDKFKSIKS